MWQRVHFPFRASCWRSVIPAAECSGVLSYDTWPLTGSTSGYLQLKYTNLGSFSAQGRAFWGLTLVEARLMPAVKLPPQHQSLAGRFLGALGHIFRSGSGRGTRKAITGKSSSEGREGADSQELPGSLAPQDVS